MNNNLQDTLNQEWEKLSDGIQNLYITRWFLSSLIDSDIETGIFNEEMKRINRTFLLSMTNPSTGYPFPYAAKEVTRKERIEILSKADNSFSQFALISAFELFEEYMTRLYLYVGHSFPSDCPCSEDIKNSTVKEIASQSRRWIAEKTKTKTRNEKRAKKYSDILNVFFKLCPDLEKKSIDYKNRVDFRLIISIIEMYRHINVHNGGYLKNPKSFISKTMDKAELSVKNKKTFFHKLFDSNDQLIQEELSKVIQELNSVTEKENDEFVQMRLQKIVDERKKRAFLKIIDCLYIDNNNRCYVKLSKIPVEGAESLGLRRDLFGNLVSDLLGFSFLINFELRRKYCTTGMDDGTPKLDQT